MSSTQQHIWYVIRVIKCDLLVVSTKKRSVGCVGKWRTLKKHVIKNTAGLLMPNSFLRPQHFWDTLSCLPWLFHCHVKGARQGNKSAPVRETFQTSANWHSEKGTPSSHISMKQPSKGCFLKQFAKWGCRCLYSAPQKMNHKLGLFQYWVNEIL